MKSWRDAIALFVFVVTGMDLIGNDVQARPPTDSSQPVGVDALS